MASRSSRGQRSVPYDLDNPFNWTTLRLKQKLESIGIKVSAVLLKHTLRQLYMDNAPSTSSRPADRLLGQEINNPPQLQPSTHQSEEEVASLIPHPTPRRRIRSATVVRDATAEDFTSAEVSGAATAVKCNVPEVGTTSNMATIDVNTLSTANIMTSIHSIQHSIADLNNCITHIMARQQASSPDLFLGDSIHLSSLPVSQLATSINQLMQSSGVLPEMLSAIDVVSKIQRKQILDGKHVSLATLLLPHFESDLSNQDDKAGKNDPWLLKHLSLSEFITAFGKFKHVFCSIYPNRCHELDMYEADIIKIANAYGDIFYD